jgi:hypothetical protein
MKGEIMGRPKGSKNHKDKPIESEMDYTKITTLRERLYFVLLATKEELHMSSKEVLVSVVGLFNHDL